MKYLKLMKERFKKVFYLSSDLFFILNTSVTNKPNPSKRHLFARFWLDKRFICDNKHRIINAQKMKFSIKDFFSNCGQIRSFLQIWSPLLKKSLMENFIFYAVNSVIWRLLKQRRKFENFENWKYVIGTKTENCFKAFFRGFC